MLSRAATRIGQPPGQRPPVPGRTGPLNGSIVPGLHVGRILLGSATRSRLGRLADALNALAFAALNASPGARALYGEATAWSHRRNLPQYSVAA